MNHIKEGATQGETPAPKTWIDQGYRSAIRDALLIQSVILLFGAVLLDGGMMFRIFGATAVAFWIGAVIMIVRRRNLPHDDDLSLIRFGYLILLPVAIAAAAVIERLGH